MTSPLRYLHRVVVQTRHPGRPGRAVPPRVAAVAPHRHVFDTANGGEVDMLRGLWIIRCACGSGRLFGKW